MHTRAVHANGSPAFSSAGWFSLMPLLTKVSLTVLLQSPVIFN